MRMNADGENYVGQQPGEGVLVGWQLTVLNAECQNSLLEVDLRGNPKLG